MGLEELRKEIIEEAEKKVEEILNEAKAKADEIIKDAKSRAEVIIKRKRDELLRRLKEKERAEYALARIEGRRMVSLKKMEYINKVFDLAFEKLKEYTKSEEYINVTLINLIAEAIKNLNVSEAVIRVNNEDLKRLRKKGIKELESILSEKVGRKLKVKLDRTPINIIGGAIVYDIDERIYYNNSFEARMNDIRDELMYKVSEILFGE